MVTFNQGQPLADAAFGAREFPTTQWSLVLAAGDGREPGGREALSALCTRYRAPLYAYLRRCGSSAADAEDLLQGFFVHLLESDLLGRARRERGRLRSFLLAALGHFVADARDRARAQKRGGGAVHVALDASGTEERLAAIATDATPQQSYERRWALATLELALERLSAEYSGAGRAPLFAALAPTLAGEERGASYRQLGDTLGLTEGALRVAAHRMRRRYRQLLRELVADTVADPAEVDGEVRFLIAALVA